MNNFNCDDAYRNGGKMKEECQEPHVWDTVDWFNRASHDNRVVANQLISMGMNQEDRAHERQG